VACAIALACLPASPTHAVNINTLTGNCKGASPEDDPRKALASLGVVNVSSTGPYAWVVCTIPRSPLASTAKTGGFYVDGHNGSDPTGHPTICAVFAYGWTGLLMASWTITSRDPSYDLLFTFTANELSTYTYTSLVCAIPPGGLLRGVTAVQ